MKIKCLIIDDKPLAIDLLTDYTGKIPFLELTGVTTNPIKGLSMIKELKIDLVFLDIQMPELTGLQFMRIAGKQCMVILTTAYAEYALDGFEHDVIDYLLKPIAFDRFYRAAEKAQQLFKFKERQNIFPQVLENLSGLFTSEFLFIKTENRIQKVDLKDVLYIEALQNYISLNTINGRVMSLQTLKGVEEELPRNEFIRVHKSYIVSLRHISSIERSRIFIGEIVIPIGDSYREAFYKLIDKQ